MWMQISSRRRHKIEECALLQNEPKGKEDTKAKKTTISFLFSQSFSSERKTSLFLFNTGDFFKCECVVIIHCTCALNRATLTLEVHSTFPTSIHVMLHHSFTFEKGIKDNTSAFSPTR
eukprot:TRINITY_DN8163_c0_g1_i1.p1 TRINITY_DN8163_c0_g1~~TRINITY_DN8163_c0_g1_i1.p1  ORF type:complete len:118 (-),score=19.11 TRINITY_DN8163_c0_g1_i1:61-414(-)